MTKKKYLRQDREDAIERLSQVANGAAYALSCMADAREDRGDSGESEALNLLSRNLYDATYEVMRTTTALEEEAQS